MIIFRYLFREVYGTLLATTLVLLLILISNQFIHYLNQAAAGMLPVSTVLQLMSLQVPLLLGLMLPLGLFLGILLGYGRLYADQEMTVLGACGFGQVQLLKMTLIFALGVSAIVAFLMFWLEPKMVEFKRHILAEAASASPLERMLPNQFFSLDNGKLVLYAQRVSHDHHTLYDIFVAQPGRPDDSANPPWHILTAGAAKTWVDPATQDPYVVFNQGSRYSGAPGRADFQILGFDQYGVRLPQPNLPADRRVDALNTAQLWERRHISLEALAELEWRISLPLSALILTLLAVPLSQVKPRQGRYAKLFPALLIYIIYADLLFVAQAWLQKNQPIAAVAGMWWVHALMLMLAALLWIYRSAII